VNCESDFVARTPDFIALMDQVLTEIERAGDAANDAWLKDPQGPVIKHIAPVIAKLGENMGVSRFVRYAGKGYVGQYVHLGAKIAVMVEMAGVTPAISGREEFAALVKELAMQVARPARRTRPVMRFRRSPREGKGDLPRADGRLGKAGQRSREDHRGQARELLQADRPHRPGLDPRHDGQDERQGGPCGCQQGVGKLGLGNSLRSTESGRGCTLIMADGEWLMA
jgi:Translation elongation factor Ts